jgi:Domain of Unknown Function (DUF748)
MASSINELRKRTVEIARHQRTRKIAIWVVSIVVGFGILLGLVAPPLIRSKVAETLSDKLHRQVSIEQIRINPYAMTLAMRGFLMKQRDSQSPAVSFDELFVNLELQSIFRLAPVIKELRLVKPYVSVMRGDDLKYNFQDLIDEFTAKPSDPSAPTPKFALNNIELIDGKIDFDDRPKKTKHTVTQLKIGVPFLSSLPSYVDIKVKPEFSAIIDGSPFHLGGVTLPFKDSRDSSLDINLDKVEIAKYLDYSPVNLNFKVPSGSLNSRIKVNFKSSTNQPTVLALTGNIGVSALEMQQKDGAPLLKLPTFEVVIDAIRVFANQTDLKSVRAEGLDLHVDRARDGKLTLANLVEIQEKSPAIEPKPKTESKPFRFSVEDISLTSATVHIDDEKPERPYKTRLDNLNIKVTGLTNEPGKKANVEISFESEGKEKISHAGTFQMTPLLADGKLEVNALRIGALRPYYDSALAAEVKDGLLDLSTQYSVASGETQPEIMLTELSANLRGFRLELPGQPEPLWRIASLALKDVAVDVAKKVVVIGAFEAKEGNGYIEREKDGKLNLARIAKPGSPSPAPPSPAKSADSDWRIDAKQIALDRFKINVNDQGNATPVKSSISEISIRGQNFSTAKNQRGKATIRAKINNKGLLQLVGNLTVNPVNAKFTVEGQNIELVPFQEYLADKVNFLLTGGAIGTKGELAYETAADGAAKLNYQGSVQVDDFGSVEKVGAQDLLKWKSLALDAVHFNLQPFQLRIGDITLADFYSRLILGADGKMNLQKLTVQGESQKVEPEAAPAQTAEKTAPAPAGDAAAPKAVTIGKINLQGGNINFSDFFVKPNYSANLTSVHGSISELKPETPGDIDLQAKLDEAAPVEIKGKINPLAKELFLDIVADARDIELSPMTPYSVKYVGYGIEKGKLSFNVKYKLENRKLSAENKIILNQLTFGDKIESPTATKLPVLLAVALLKDRNGVIDVDLPISGSLDDPQFSVGGLVLRIIINLITKAVTAPFSLLASAFSSGGVSGDELSYVEFAAGRATLDQTDQEKIATLAKALNNRPALKLDIIGRADPSSDLEGLKRVSIERKVKAQKLKDLANKGQAPRSLEDVQIDKSEYPQFLKAAYGDESFPKPRNIIGLAKDLPVPEMEKLMMQNAKASDDDLRQLANQRAQSVRDALLANGQIGADRLFVVAAKPLTAEEKAKLKGRPNRVDFTMK